MATRPDFTNEARLCERGYTAVCGVDEAGRGPLAGPVYAAAVILPPDCEIEGLNDSKKISEKKRELLFDVIREKAVAFAVASASVEEIEEHNILQATFLAMNRAVAALDPPADFVLVDGNRTPKGLALPCETLIGGDAKSCSIAAASILAKVSRDRYIREMDAVYPQYGFAKHKGYGTKEHMDAIRAHGPCPIHRPSFLRGCTAHPSEIAPERGV
ncbi:MAG: ribonuclease HII [Clostridia bacterium]|nr:ribonuclease HII [Clostridia bacterium]